MFMEKLISLIDKFVESDVAKTIRELSEAKARTDPWEIWLMVILFAIPIFFVLYMSISIKITDNRDARRRAKGTYHKELPIEEIEISLKDGENSFRIACKTKTILTPNASEAEEAKKENKRRMQSLFKGIVSAIVSKEEVCLLARVSNISAVTEVESDDFFRLDVCPVWEKRKNEEWLSRYETLRDAEGHTIAIRGADEQVIARGYDILIPKEEAAHLCAMSGEELIGFCKAENCKLQIREKGSIISFSEIYGFRQEEIVEKIRSVAEKQGYKVKEIGQEEKR